MMIASHSANTSIRNILMHNADFAEFLGIQQSKQIHFEV